ncbi:MAG TPA: hypothetical protein ENH13_05030 [Euryarchaeota archaeon]|nr:hypothetical protein BMS3Abin16_00679 [archaeon BMS3Abin16]GBE55881.1 hypothetical protein BMS3Bbin16_00076 [archaeon BMS3Bbin16]HDH28476.1 hypothetical protein [Euryarchaeota archaeon]HDY73993.1 hypothetical protein [Euryarchaeota archaeon]
MRLGIINAVLGLVLLPFSIGFTKSFISQLSSFETFGMGETAFAAGAITYIILRRAGLRMSFLSTLAHELTHAIWGLAFRAKIKDIRVKRESGFVRLTKSNFLIMLAPYFFPFYTVLVVLFSFFIKQKYLILIFFLIGFTLAFHIVSTIESLRAGQPDIYRTGAFFSLPLIYISNLTMILLILKFISPKSVDITLFMNTALDESLALIQRIYLFF